MDKSLFRLLLLEISLFFTLAITALILKDEVNWTGLSEFFGTIHTAFFVHNKVSDAVDNHYDIKRALVGAPDSSTATVTQTTVSTASQ